jgi:phosphoglucosamine mutase
MVTEEVCDSKRSLFELAEPVKLYPQCMKNIRVKDKGAVFADNLVLEEKQEIENLIKGKGRVLLRKSGTEPVVRVMVESEENCEEYTQRLADFIIKRGHSVE